MTAWGAAAVVLCYFTATFVAGRLAFKNSKGFTGGSFSWAASALAMISACFSGISFVSVPGMAGSLSMGYMQTCIGFMAGYLIIAYVLAPLYFKLGVTSIYQYLDDRFQGMSAYRTGAWMFFIAKLIRSAIRLYLFCLIMQMLIFTPFGLPFWLNVIICTAGVWLYTFRGGVSSVIGADILKTVLMVSCLILTAWSVFRALGMSIPQIAATGGEMGLTKVFFLDDPRHPYYFFKQVIGGIAVVLATTGLDQDLMQRVIVCRSPKDARKNLIVSTLSQTAIIFVFLCLGVMLYIFAPLHGITETGDRLLPAVVSSGALPPIAGILFLTGLAACAFPAGGSALTALTTSFWVDILGKAPDTGSDPDGRKYLRLLHSAMALATAAAIIIFSAFNSRTAIDAVFTVASYTYGPILGLFAFGILTKRDVGGIGIPIVCLSAPAICYMLSAHSATWFGGWKFSYELLIINASLTFAGLWAISKKAKGSQEAR